MIGTTTCAVCILKLKSVLYYKHHVVMTTEKTNPMSPMAIRTYLSKRSKVLDNVIAVAVREKELLRIESDKLYSSLGTTHSMGRILRRLKKDFFASTVFSHDGWNIEDFTLHLLASGRGVMVDAYGNVHNRTGIDFGKRPGAWCETPLMLKTVGLEVPECLSAPFTHTKNTFFHPSLLEADEWTLDDFNLHILSDGTALMVDESGLVYTPCGTENGPLSNMVDIA